MSQGFTISAAPTSEALIIGYYGEKERWGDLSTESNGIMSYTTAI